MQLHLEGSASVGAPRQAVFSMLTDSTFIGKSIPDSEEVKVIDANTVEAKIKVRIAIVSSTLRVRLTIGERVPPSGASMSADASGSGSNIKIATAFTLEEEGPSRTKIDWKADADVTGVMAGIGSGLLKGFASKRVAEIFEGITRAIEGAAPR
jgi:carbon monoxide dehydrogenase subunit G